MLLHTDLHVGRHVRFFIQEKNALSTHRALVGGRRTSDVDELDVQNGFLDLTLPLFESGKFTLRAGRQELLFGRQRFVGPSDWSNTRKIFDGFSGLVEVRHWNLTAFWTRPVKVSKYYFNHDDLNTVFFGLHATGKMPVTEAGLDLYWYGLRNRKAVYNGTGGHETRHTLGGHTYGKIHGSGFDYDLGGSYQFGSVGARDIHAFMLLDQLGYRFHQVRSTPRFYAGFDYASGSHTVGGDVGTFNQLFPTAHQTLGYTDIVGRQNIMDVNGGLSFNPTRRLTARLDGYDFWRASAIDALYDKRGAVVRPGGPDTSRKVGEELDLTFRYQLDRHSRVELGYNHFFPSTFIRESGPHQSVDFGYLGLQFTF